MQETLCALLIAGTAMIAQSTTPSGWVGVWQAELDGQPSTILTLAMDDGTLQGTLVLNGISRDNGTPHITVRETHFLLHPRKQLRHFWLRARHESVVSRRSSVVGRQSDHVQVVAAPEN